MKKKEYEEKEKEIRYRTRSESGYGDMVAELKALKKAYAAAKPTKIKKK